MQDVAEFARVSLSRWANPEKAAGMQAYMKTDMPFYGVQKPARAKILREMLRQYPIRDRGEYEETVLALWVLPHREEKYLAQMMASKLTQFIVPDSLPVYHRFITEGRWWDFVDEAATHQVRELVRSYPVQIWPEVDRWIDSEDMWLRRAALICQVGLKEDTDSTRLFEFCGRRMQEQEFFIRKAIGWSLREYAKTDPEAVAAFVTRNRDALSGLSFREATKHIGSLVH